MKKLFIISLLILLLAGCATSNTSDETIIFTNNSISTSLIDGIQIKGTDLVINKEGTYTLSGTCSNGSVTINASKVTLILDNLNLASSDNAPIICSENSIVNVEVLNENTLSDSVDNNDENAVIKCKENSIVTIGGDGILNIKASYKNGIKVKGENSILNIENLNLNIDADVNDAINAEGTLNIISGNITINAGDDALHCDLLLNIGEHNGSPIININSCYEGIEGATVNIYSGDININSSDDCINAANSDLTDYDFNINIYGGTINAYTSQGDGFDSNGDLNISGGNIVVFSANRADNQPLDADGTINISGGEILAAGGSNGMGVNINASQSCLIFNQVAISDSFSINSGETSIFETTVKCDVTYVLYSSSNLSENETYSLTNNQASVDAIAQIGTIRNSTGNNFYKEKNIQKPNEGIGNPPENMTNPKNDIPMNRPENSIK